MCNHLHVTVKWKLYARETRYEPAEYIGKAFCDDCGEEMEPEDVPEEAERKDIDDEAPIRWRHYSILIKG